MIYKIIIAMIGYLGIIFCGYLIRPILRKYEKDVDLSGLKSAGMAIGTRQIFDFFDIPSTLIYFSQSRGKISVSLTSKEIRR